MAIAASGAALIEEKGLVTEKSADYKPDCVFIGGISGWIHPEMQLNGGPAIESVQQTSTAWLVSF